MTVDVRTGSPAFGQWFGCYLSADNKRQLWVPEGLAHGFCVTSETALFAYKCTDYYDSDSEVSIRWDDPTIGVDWSLDEPSLSSKDSNAQLLTEIPRDRLPRYRPAGPDE